MTPRYDVIIVGGGPAGAAAAITLAKRDRELARRSLLLDSAVFPRDKLCAGGVVPQAERLLQSLGVVADVPSVAIRELRFEAGGGRRAFEARRLFRVVRRKEFDHALLRTAARRGIRVQEGEPVLRVERTDAALRVVTRRGEYSAAIVIGADGAYSRVRRALVGPSPRRPMVALEVTTPRLADETTSAELDFRPVMHGLRGYAWHFPAIERGQPCAVRGVGGTDWPRRSPLRGFLARALDVHGLSLDTFRVKGWSLPIYDPDLPQGAQRVLLAGDAVGVDPWLGEGISVALGTGMLAGHAAAEGLGAGSLDFSDHATRIRESGVGFGLERNRRIADTFYEAAARPDGLASFLTQGATA